MDVAHCGYDASDESAAIDHCHDDDDDHKPGKHFSGFLGIGGQEVEEHVGSDDRPAV